MKQLIRKISTMVMLAAVCIMSTSVAAASTTPVTLTAGVQNQAGGYLVLSETAAGMLKKGDLVFSVKGEEASIFLEDVKVEAQGGIKGVKSKVTEGKNGNVKVTLKRESNEAATIILSDFVFTVDRAVPEGSHDLEISGSAITSYDDDKIIVKDFIKIGTPNTQDIEMNSLTRGTSRFTIDTAVYELNGKSVEMNGKPYLQGEGYIMVPLRYVAEAFGVKEENIVFGQGTVTLFAGSRTISLTAGQKEAVVNGAAIGMKAPVEIEEGRMYVPASQLANLLGITCKWDEASKTASFINE